MSNTTEQKQIFRGLIRGVADEPANRNSVLADAHHQCNYPEIPAYVDSVRERLCEAGVEEGDCLTVELGNSVRGALSVLGLLDAGYSFMAIPASGRGARAGGAHEASVDYARFTRWVVSVNTEKPAAPLKDTPVASWFSVRENPQFDATLGVSPEPRLYFRTSGSLGTPKLAMHAYQQFYDNAMNVLKARGFNSGHRIALPTPIFHLYGIGAGFLPGLAGGASVDLQDRSNVLVFLEREADFNPNVAYVTPPFCESLIRTRRSPRKYEYMVTSGDRISESAFKRSEDLHGTMICQYGTTELGMVSACGADEPYEIRSATVGHTVGGVDIRIVPLPGAPPGQPGELQVRHKHGFLGYVDLSGNTLVPENAFADGWYRTGDLATIGPQDTLIVLGRCDLSVNRSGVLLPLAEVESQLRDIPDIEEAAVTTGGESLRGAELVAFCKTVRTSKANSEELVQNYARSAAPYAIPDRLVIVDELPKLPSGKIDRQELNRLAQETA